ncbi:MULTISPECIES: hypothetical protein [unclassified Sphingomonas]|uniref:hypothetical protein n=1 Tax=unclassified Sphingomonas TaxID=196159 RepID=UPI002151ABBC|nr:MULTISPECIES: hypothetical protein [unclassified Sphingomonas]MCR5869742.1 hypothetical protein [Sphingomonas sp. J344]UUX98555.1 hypothetical protein LRS08_13465 [Sphingomonas sp. J315]
MRALFLLAATVALAGCNQQPAEQPTLAQNEAAAREAAADLKGWDRVFGYPTETIGRLNQYGYRIGAYAAAGTGFAAKGTDITLSQSGAKTPNKGNVSVTGPDAAAIDSIAFSLALTDDANAETAKKRLTDIVRAFLFQYGIDDKKALDAIASETATEGKIGDTPFAIALTKGDAARTLTVTFRRPSATAPAEAMVGNSQQP